MPEDMPLLTEIVGECLFKQYTQRPRPLDVLKSPWLAREFSLSDEDRLQVNRLKNRSRVKTWEILNSQLSFASYMNIEMNTAHEVSLCEESCTHETTRENSKSSLEAIPYLYLKCRSRRKSK